MISNTNQSKLGIIIELTKKINSTLELDQLLDQVIQSASAITQAEEGSILLWDEPNRRLTFYKSSSGHKDVLTSLNIPDDQGIAGEIFQTRQPLNIKDTRSDGRHLKNVDHQTTFVTRNLLGVPMITETRPVGVIEVVNSIDRDYFNEEDQELLMLLADQAAIAIVNRKLLTEVSEKANELAALYQLSQAISSQIPNNKIFVELLSIILELFHVRKGFIAFIEDKKLKVFAQQGVPNTWMDTLDDLHIETILANPYFIEDHQLTTYLMLPIVHQTKFMGILFLADRTQFEGFSSYDVNLLSTMAHQLAESYSQIQYLKEEEEKKRIQKELEITSRLQQSFFPKVFPKRWKDKVYGVSVGALEVVGDFYDMFELPDDRYGIVIADVSGKGLPAGIFMATTRSVIRSMAFTYSKPSEVLENANRLIYQDSESGMFVTLFYAIIEPEKKIFTYANAGHNPPMLLRKDQGNIEYLAQKGKPLGVIEKIKLQEKEITYFPEDILFLFTDGLIEACNTRFSEFGEERVEQLLTKGHALSPKLLCDSMFTDIYNFIGEMPVHDDITLLTIKF